MFAMADKIKPAAKAKPVKDKAKLDRTAARLKDKADARRAEVEAAREALKTL
jgi:hypothetical protein